MAHCWFSNVLENLNSNTMQHKFRGGPGCRSSVSLNPASTWGECTPGMVLNVPVRGGTHFGSVLGDGPLVLSGWSPAGLFGLLVVSAVGGLFEVFWCRGGHLLVSGFSQGSTGGLLVLVLVGVAWRKCRTNTDGNSWRPVFPKQFRRVWS